MLVISKSFSKVPKGYVDPRDSVPSIPAPQQSHGSSKSANDARIISTVYHGVLCDMLQCASGIEKFVLQQDDSTLEFHNA